jgi:DNA-binding transcriptional ArsR family regulator
MSSRASEPARRLSEPMAELFARRFRALADPTRLKLLAELQGREMTVQELTDALQTSQQNTSKHLGVLHQAGFVSRRKLGVYARYRVPEPSTFELLELMRAGLAREVAVAREALEDERAASAT